MSNSRTATETPWGFDRPMPEGKINGSKIAASQLQRLFSAPALLTDIRAASSSNVLRRRTHSGRINLPRFPMISIPMFVSDLLALSLTCGIAILATRYCTRIALRDLLTVSLALLVPIVLGNLITGIYPGVGINPVVEFRHLSRVSVISFLATATFACLSKPQTGWLFFFSVAWPLQFVLAPLCRAAMRKACRAFPTSNMCAKPVPKASNWSCGWSCAARSTSASGPCTASTKCRHPIPPSVI